MMATDTATPSNGSALRRHWVALLGIATLAVIIALVVLVPGLRTLAADTWHEMINIQPIYLALIVVFKVTQALFSALTWCNALQAGWPRARLPYRFVLGLDQGQDALNTVAPARAGTWAMLGTYTISIPGARAPKMLAVWAVQALAFSLFAAINYTIVAIGLPNRSQGSGGITDRMSGFISDHPLAAAGIVAAIVLLVIIVAVKGRRSLQETRQQVREGLAILGTPSRYFRLLFLPSLGSYIFRCASYITMLAAFGIPISIWTVTLALSAQSVAGAVRITPGGIGTTQAIDVIALRDYASPETVTAYSLSDIAISAIVSLTLAITALLSAYGWHGTLRIVRRRKNPVLLTTPRRAAHGGKPTIEG
jgi:uncharacterized membrane protein YbhN (UPF0104 family)